MPKRELSKCREWERERRERLKTCFDALAKLLPSHDPSITPSKLEILQRAASHITDLQQKNKELTLGDQRTTSVAQRDEIRRLRDRVRKLNSRTEQLVTLLRTAGLKIPKECLSICNSNQNQLFKGPPRLWSGKISRDKAEQLRKQHENKQTSVETNKTNEKDKQTTKTRKRKRISSQNKKTGNRTIENGEALAASPAKKSIRKNSRRSSDGAAIAAKVAAVLGPGTLILANGNVVPVPAVTTPTSTLHRIQLMPTVPQNTSRQVIVMKTNTSSTNNARLPTIKPKTALNMNRTVLPSKIAIPALPKRRVNSKKRALSTKNQSVNSNNKNSIIPQENTKTEEPKTTEKSEKTSEIIANINDKNTNENVEQAESKEIENCSKETENKSKNVEMQNQAPVSIVQKQNENENTDQVAESTEKPVDNPPSEPDHSELSNDIFASLGSGAGDVDSTGGQHAESMSPTAAFLLAFPLVSTLTGGSRISDTHTGCSTTGNGHNSTGNSHRNENNNNSEDDRQSTPTTLLQIGGTMNLDSNKPNSETVLQIGDPVISIDNAKLENNLKQTESNHISRNLDNFDFFSNNTLPNSCLNNSQSINRPNLQSSNACLYEQRSIQQSATIDANSYTNFPENSMKSSGNVKNRVKQQVQRPPVNWMTTPDIRPSFATNDHHSVSGTGDYFLPPFSDVYNGISSSDNHNNNLDQQSFASWSSGNRNVLPTLLGDLALNTNNNNHSQCYQPFEASAQNPQTNKESFLSVSSILVGGKPRSGKKHREKASTKTNYDSGQKKYGYSAEELLGNQYETRPPYLDAPSQMYPAQNSQIQQQNHPKNIPYQKMSQNSNYQQGYHRQQQFGTAYHPPAPLGPNGEFSSLLSKTFDSFVPVKPPPSTGAPPVSSTGFDGYCTTGRSHTSTTHHSVRPSATDSERRRHSRRSLPTTHNGVQLPPPGGPPNGGGAANSASGFSDLGFLSMSGTVNSPLLPEEFHSTAAPFPPPPPPLPTPVASSLTNFNLSAIFPEINKTAAVSTPPSAPVWPHSKPPVTTGRSQPRYQQQNQLQNTHYHEQNQHNTTSGGGKSTGGYCHPQQHSSGQQLPHDSLYGGTAPAQSFPPLLGHHQMQTIGNTDVSAVPTSFSFSFASH